MNIDNALNKTAAPDTAAAVQKRNAETTTAKTASGNAQATAQTATTASTAGASDSVRLSPQYQTLEKSVATSSSFNAEKVASIKAAIANGQFTIDAGKIADGVLATAKELISARSAY